MMQQEEKRIGAVLLAAGSGSRMGGQNKLVRDLMGKSVFEHSLLALCACDSIDTLVIVVSNNLQEFVAQILKRLDFQLPIQMVLGGACRAESVKIGAQALAEAGIEYVLIHDAARCLVDQQTIMRCVVSTLKKGSGVAGIASVDSLKQVDKNGKVIASVPREIIIRAQTPQMFCLSDLLKAYEKAKDDLNLYTDDAQLVESMGFPVYMVQGDEENLKITREQDMLQARSIMMHRNPQSLLEAFYSDKNSDQLLRIGYGEDTHALVMSDKGLRLGGVAIPNEKSLLGHSDADVLAHATADALLGAAALGDIGKWFPDTDAKYAGADSMKLLLEVVELLQERKFFVKQIDATIIAQKPKLAAFIDQMRENLAITLQIPIEYVNVKATTSEKLGFEGKEEGITVRCVCMIFQQKKDACDFRVK